MMIMVIMMMIMGALPAVRVRTPRQSGAVAFTMLAVVRIHLPPPVLVILTCPYGVGLL
jgi:hypothetical protein